MPSKSFKPMIRVRCAAMLDLRFQEEVRVMTSDLIALLAAVDTEDVSEATAALGKGISVQGSWPMLEADFRALTGVTSGPALRAMFERLRKLHLFHPNEMRYMQAFAIVEHHAAEQRGKRGFLIAHVGPEVVVGFAPVSEAPWIVVDARWLHGLTLPSAVLLLKYLSAIHLGTEAADRSMLGRGRVWRNAGGVRFRMNGFQFARGFLGRCIVRRFDKETMIYHPDEEVRVLRKVRAELKPLGLHVGYERPRSMLGRAPITLQIEGKFIHHVEGHDPRSVEKAESEAWQRRLAAAMPPPGAGSDLDHGVYYE